MDLETTIRALVVTINDDLLGIFFIQVEGGRKDVNLADLKPTSPIQ